MYEWPYKWFIYVLCLRSDAIYSAKYDGSGLIEVLRGHEYLSHPFAVTMYGGEVYWTDWRTNTLAKANKWTGNNVTVVQRTNTQPFDLQVYHPSRQPQGNLPTLFQSSSNINIANACFNAVVYIKVPWCNMVFQLVTHGVSEWTWQNQVVLLRTILNLNVWGCIEVFSAIPFLSVKTHTYWVKFSVELFLILFIISGISLNFLSAHHIELIAVHFGSLINNKEDSFNHFVAFIFFLSF